MTKNEKKKFIRKLTIILTLVILTVTSICIALYLKTDLLKSNRTLFMKYASQGIGNVKTIAEALNVPKEQKYNVNTEYTIRYVEGIETTAENADSSMNKVKISVDENVDKENQYDHKKITILNENEEILNAEYLQNDNKIGIKALDIDQFLYIENSGIENFIKRLDFTEEQINKILDIIEADKMNIEFTNEQIKELESKYLRVIEGMFEKGNFQKQQAQTIKIGNKEIVANAYVLTTTRERLNSTYLIMLDNAKQDEIILSKLDEIQKIFNKIGFIYEEEINLREEYNKKIEEIVENINKNNIGNEETAITVYESNKQTVKITMQGIDKEINIEYLMLEGQEIAEFRVTQNKKNIQRIVLNKSEKDFNIYIENKKLKLSLEQKYEETNTNSIIKYENGKEILEVKANRKANTINEIEEKITFNKQNSIQLDNLNDQKFAEIIEAVKKQYNQERDKLMEKIDINDLEEILNTVGLKKTIRILEEGVEITEAQKNRFNARFEFLQGKKLSSERILEEIEQFERYIVDFIIASNDILKIQVDRVDNEDERVEKLKEVVEDMNMEQNISLEYDEETGLVKYIVMTIVRKD